MTEVPILKGDALAAVDHRGSHLQIIASAGSGKTEVVAQRVASLIAEQIDPRAIVAFTFTERAAQELKDRIALRVEHRSGRAGLDALSGLFVGTIHSYCFRLLQQYVPRYETYDVLDDNQLTAFLSREATRLAIRQLDAKDRVFAAIAAFLESVEVIENELLDPTVTPEPFRSILLSYYATLERYRLLTYGQQIVRAVRELEDPGLAAVVHNDLRHLIVDEYQDVNPAQERLVELLVSGGAELCVVGDDSQAIYQWRGSDVSNIVTFAQRYSNVATFTITTNRRSRPQIVAAANSFEASIPGRLQKTMSPHRSGSGTEPEVAIWAADRELDEAGWIANLILDAVDAGADYKDIAVLVRGRAAYPRLIEQFASFDIPVQPGGRTGLFDQPEAHVLGQTFAWLGSIDWRGPFGPPQRVTQTNLLDEYEKVFDLSKAQRAHLRRMLAAWREVVPRTNRVADLVGELYELLDALDVRTWDLTKPMQVNRLGTLARFSSLLADYESVRRRARPDPDAPGEQVGGEDRGTWYYRNLALHIINYAQGAYEGFDGEPDFALNAIDLTTVHRAKGLEWPVVFLPSLTSNRFPSSRTGRPQSWLLPRTSFPASRYEGTDADERRLFYVGMTRARDWLSISRHERVNTKAVAASPYWKEASGVGSAPEDVRLSSIASTSSGDDATIEISFSELDSYLECGAAYRLRSLLGFQPRLAPELGYGKAVHHVLRSVADYTKARGTVPTDADVDDILNTGFFLPTANKPAHRQLKAAARRLITEYVNAHSADLFRVWETERPFELHLDGITVIGRADVILDEEGGVPTALALLDYKTSTSPDRGDHSLQLQIYADAGRREGLDVRGAYVHDLKAGIRITVDVAQPAVSTAEVLVLDAGKRLVARDYTPKPGLRCRTCEVRTICAAAKR
jgi:DNA helicase-2/ATP-dependent DNA helicase PcrA